MAVIPLTRTGPEEGGDFEYHWSGDFLKVHLLSDVGKKRAGNEDSCLLCAPEDRSVAHDHGYLVAVADGMGGVSGGGFASRLALQSLVDSYYDGVVETIPERLRASVGAANRRIFEEAESHPEYFGMGTTVSAMLIHGTCAYVAQVGDSRVYLHRVGEGIWQITDDHSLVAEQVRNGFISEEQARTHSLRNLITRAVGTKESVKVDLFTFPVRQNDRILICSDGLTGVVDDEVISSSLDVRNLQGAARALVGRALEGGGPDNITVALVEVAKAPPQTDCQSGATTVNLSKPGFFNRLRGLFS
ncbi:MAG: Stp1/IreP family PP2C-type Ser/Thr phosphatase [bacterium]|nr:Stp1/IreP family PP2C-type Ser/Thr phosphatase [bacterium]